MHIPFLFCFVFSTCVSWSSHNSSMSLLNLFFYYLINSYQVCLPPTILTLPYKEWDRNFALPVRGFYTVWLVLKMYRINEFHCTFIIYGLRAPPSKKSNQSAMTALSRDDWFIFSRRCLLSTQAPYWVGYLSRVGPAELTSHRNMAYRATKSGLAAEAQGKVSH